MVLRIIFSIFTFLTLIGQSGVVSSQNSEFDQDSIVRKLLIDYQIYGEMRENFTTISKNHVKKFNQLFIANAIVYNPFTGEHDSIDKYISYVIENYPFGTSIILSEYNIVEKETISDSTLLISILANLQISGYTFNNEKIEKTVSVIFKTLFNYENKQCLIAGVREYFLTPIESIEVQLFSPLHRRKILSDVKVNLIIADTIFQQNISDYEGIVRFFGIPRTSAFKIRMHSKKKFSLLKDHWFYPDEEDFNPLKPIFIPVYNQKYLKSKSSNSRLSCSGYFSSYLSSLDLDKSTFIDNTYYRGLSSSVNAGFGAGIYVEYVLYRSGYFNYSFLAGWGINKLNYSLSITELSQFMTSFNNENKIYHLSGNGIKETGKINSFVIPLLCKIEHIVNSRLIKSWDIIAGVNWSIPVQGEYNIKGNFNKTVAYSLKNTSNNSFSEMNINEYNQYYNIVGDINYINLYSLILGIKGGITIPTGIDAISISTRLGINTYINDIFKLSNKYFFSCDYNKCDSFTSIINNIDINMAELFVTINYRLP